MKREEKNLKSIKKILDSAIQEFADKGYGLSSINTICNKGDISKGIMYHYFKDKDEIYLACIQECFDTLTAFLKEQLTIDSSDRLKTYFDSRHQFFEENPLYQSLFCDAIISPPLHLEEAIRTIKEEFDALNLAVLRELLDGVKLREGYTHEQIIEVFRLFQDFVNARYKMTPNSEVDLKEHDNISSRALNILLYGVAERRLE